MSLARRDTALTELMDDPECDPVRLDRTLRRFWLVNGAVTRWGHVYRTRLRPAFAAAGDRPLRILDVGCGGGDVLRRVVRMVRRDGFAVEGLGIDPDPRAQRAAAAGPGLAGVEFRRAHSTELARSGERFDAVISNHVLHHLSPAELGTVICDSEALARGVCVHSDIARGRLAYAAFALGASVVAPGTFLRVDGLRSIRRSYTRPELAALLPAGWRVEQAGPFRLLAVRCAGDLGEPEEPGGSQERGAGRRGGVRLGAGGPAEDLR
ncbi:methyltransferase domain-containing protein [Leucobacter massiliensis]|uniref:Methyltransferase n=1 Tax=Leucobacter massiliensis TaxID=1686285 RepID=A0A2S9QQI7_9MICO|nr:methyltransferase domain-containing protein [Leucobacter massiliensis]PRI11848.1 methyltransferase [Leucobacter massiliensis]